MSASDESLLTVLRATAEIRGTGRLEAQVVRAVGETLGMPDAALVEAIDRLARTKALRLSFGGTVEIAEAVPAVPGGYHVHVNGNVGGSIAVGPQAVAIGANATVLGYLAAAKCELAHDPSPEARALTKAADDLAEIANAPKTPGMTGRLKTVGAVLDKGLSLPPKIVGAAEALKKAYDILAPLVGG